MCGIAGAALKPGTEVPRAALAALATALAHRGPDGEAIETSGNVALVHRRLAIIDLISGDQPLRDDAGVSLIANAEIYNDLDLRQELSGYRTNSDCESALRLYLRDGVAFADKLRGMYAIAIHDRRDGSLVLARDPFGIKPLYLAETANGVWFASEAQALIAAGVVPAAVSASARDQLLAMQFASTCAFPGIDRVAPGETIVIRDGRVAERRRRPALSFAPAPTSEADALAAFDRAFNDSVRAHCRSDVPYGMFLSGGIDSSAVLTAMSRQHDAPVLAFTAAFPGTDAHDERAVARAVAEKCRARHVEIEVGVKDFWRTLPAIAAAVDDPAADYAVVPSYLLAARARSEVKVILTGEGGDELFAGYGRYRSAVRPWPFRRKPWHRSAFAGLGMLRSEPTDWRSAIDRIEATVTASTRMSAAQAIDIAAWLPYDLLIKLDRCLMAHGIEGRVPFLDPKVAQVAAMVPDSLKVKDGLGKYLVRRWLADALPGYDAFARKRGFSVPVGAWMASEGRRVGPLVARQPGIADIASPEAVVDLFAVGDDHTAAARWHLLFYALWHNRHMLGRKADGDVFDVLSA
ncbi:MAG: asparagine synthase (glutamine-hydrolyzing) [Alphaproteobacteria bacterium]|nr:asparagine synthase (glutamine-hydrolyzing) [Alphaproteobacteria bacterium]